MEGSSASGWKTPQSVRSPPTTTRDLAIHMDVIFDHRISDEITHSLSSAKPWCYWRYTSNSLKSEILTGLPPPPYFMGETGPFSTNLNWVASQLALEPVDFRPHTLLPTSSVLMGKCCRHLYPCVDKKFESISGPIKLSYVHVFLCMKNVQNQLNSNMDPFCIYIAIFSSAARERIDFSPDGPRVVSHFCVRSDKEKGAVPLNSFSPRIWRKLPKWRQTSEILNPLRRGSSRAARIEAQKMGHHLIFRSCIVTTRDMIAT